MSSAGMLVLTTLSPAERHVLSQRSSALSFTSDQYHAVRLGSSSAEKEATAIASGM